MSTNLRDVNNLNATGVGAQDDGDPEMREGQMGQRVPASIVATGREDSSIRKGYSLNTASRNGSKRSGSR